MRYLLMVVGVIGMVMGIANFGNSPPHGPPLNNHVIGAGLLVAGAVFFAIGAAIRDLVAAIEGSGPPQKPRE